MKRFYKQVISLMLSIATLLIFFCPAVAATSSNYKLTGNEADDIIAVAVAQKNLDRGDFGFSGSWCGKFLSWCAQKANSKHVSKNITGGLTAIEYEVNNGLGEFYCFSDAKTNTNGQSIYYYLKTYNQNGHSISKSGFSHIHEVSRNSFIPKKGDIIIFLWSYDKTHPQFSHVGFVRSDYDGKGTVYTVEGNTSGGVVALRSRTYSDEQIVGFVRPNYSNSTPTPQTKPVTVKFNKPSLSLDLVKNSSQTVTLTIGGDLPAGSQLLPSVSNRDIVAIDWGGNSIGMTASPVITAKAAGQTTLTCSVIDGSTKKPLAKTQLKITVTAPTLTIKYSANGGMISSSQYRTTSSGMIQKGSTDVAVAWPYGYGHENGLYNAATFGLSRPGYSFVGWSLSKDGSTRIFEQDEKIKAETLYPSLKNGNATITLYAVWKADSTALNASPSNLTLDLSNNSSQKITLTWGGYLQEKWEIRPLRSNPDVVTSEWDTYSGGTAAQAIITGKNVGTSTITYSLVDTNTETTLATTSVKVTVTAPTYTVRYDANGGTRAPTAQTKVYQNSLTLSNSQPTREGYSFVGWATSTNGPVQYKPGGQYTANQNVTLYAVWSPQNSVTLTLVNSVFNVEAYDRFTLNFSYTGDVKKVTYDIGNESVCFFDYTDSTSKQNGTTNISMVFKAQSAGTTNIAINLLDGKGNVIASQKASVTVTEKITAPVLLGEYEYNLGSSSMEAGESFDIWVKGSYSDGTKKDVTSLCSVSSSNTSILAVNGCTITALKAGNAQILLTLPEGRTVSKTISVVSASEEKEPLWISFNQPEYTCYVDVPADEYHSTPFTLHYSTNATDAIYHWSISDLSLIYMAQSNLFTSTTSPEISMRHNKVGDATLYVTITQDGQTATASCKIHVRERQDRQNVIDFGITKWRNYSGIYPHLQVSFRYHPMHYSITISSFDTGESVWQTESSNWLGLGGENRTYGDEWDISSLPSGKYRATVKATNSFGTVTTGIFDFEL